MAESTPRRPGPRVRSLVRWGLAAVFLALAAGLLWSDPEPLHRLAETPPSVLLFLGALVVVNQTLMAWRFQVAFEQAGGHVVPFATWFKLTAVGQFLNLFVPQLGNVYRGVMLKRQHSVSYLSYASGLFAYVWLDLLMGFAIAFLVIAIFDRNLPLAGFPVIAWLSLVIVGLVTAPFVIIRVLARVRLAGGAPQRLKEKALAMVSVIERALKDRRFLARVFAINALSSAGQVASYWLCFRAVGGSLSWSALIVFQVFARLSSLVAVTPGNLGLNELALGLLAKASRQSVEQGVTVSLLVRAVSSVMQVILGVISGGGSLLLGRRAELEQQQD